MLNIYLCGAAIISLNILYFYLHFISNELDPETGDFYMLTITDFIIIDYFLLLIGKYFVYFTIFTSLGNFYRATWKSYFHLIIFSISTEYLKYFSLAIYRKLKYLACIHLFTLERQIFVWFFRIFLLFFA